MTPPTSQPASLRADSAHTPRHIPLPRTLDGDVQYHPAPFGQSHHAPIRLYRVIIAGIPDDYHQGPGLTVDRVVAELVRLNNCRSEFLQPGEFPTDAAIFENGHLATIVRFFPDGRGTWRTLDIGIDDWTLNIGDPMSYGSNYPTTFDPDNPPAVGEYEQDEEEDGDETEEGDEHKAAADADSDELARMTLAEACEAVNSDGSSRFRPAELIAKRDADNSNPDRPTDLEIAHGATYVENWMYLTKLYRDDLHAAIDADDHVRGKRLIETLVAAEMDLREAEDVLFDLLNKRPGLRIQVGERWYYGEGTPREGPVHRLVIEPRLVPVESPR